MTDNGTLPGDASPGEGGSTPPSTAEQALTRQRGPAWLSRALLAVVAVAIVIAIVRTVRQIDVGSVVEALTRLPWWSAAILLALLLVRQVLNAAPLAIYLPEAGLYRASVNDLSASTAAAFAPAPSDMVLRVTMFRSWGFDGNRALAATAMNALTFFIARFSAPLLGFILFPLLHVPPGLRLLDLVSLLVAAALIVSIIVLTRGEAAAAHLGELLGKGVRLVRRGTDPTAWADMLRSFQQHLTAGFSHRFPRALGVSYAMMLTDLTIFTLCLRFLGVGSQDAGLADIAAAYFFAFPLTMFPAQGLGVMDAAMLGSLSETVGPHVIEPALAAALVWRTFTVAGPFLLGLIAMVLWKRGVDRHAL